MFYKYSWFIFVFFLVACTSSEFQQETQQEIAVSAPTVSPSIISTPVPTDIKVDVQTLPTATVEMETGLIMPTLTPHPTQLPNSFQPPLPDLIINLAANSNPLSFCNSTQLGQIWMSQYPYSSAIKVLADENVAYANPIWSPDGDWIAYVSTDTKSLRKETQPNGEWRYFQDSIWTMNSDGTDQRLVSTLFERAEFYSTENDTCNVTNGINSIIGWSFDSEWLAFTVLSKDVVNEGLMLYVSNINTGNTFIVAERLEDAFWFPNSDKLVVTTNGLQSTIGIISMDQSDGGQILIDSPSTFLPEYVSVQSQIDFEGDGLFVIVKDTTFYNAPVSLWHVDINEQVWSEIKDINLDDKHGINLDITGQFPLLCAQKDGINSIEVFKPLTWHLIREISFEKLSCRISRLLDSDGNEIVSFTSFADRQSIWVSVINGQNSIPQEIINGNLVGIPNEYEIAFYSWKAAVHTTK